MKLEHKINELDITTRAIKSFDFKNFLNTVRRRMPKPNLFLKLKSDKKYEFYLKWQELA